MTYEVDGQQYIGLLSGANVIAFALPDSQVRTATGATTASTGGGQ
jgi:hypothetical protein